MTLETVLALASRDGRVCPQPDWWARLYELLPETRTDAYGAIPAAPLILDAWQATGDEQKRLRLLEHLEWADRHGALRALHDFLAAMPDSAWHHAGD